MQTGFEQNCFNPSQLPQMQFLHRFGCLGVEIVRFSTLVLNVGDMQVSAFPNLCKQHLSCPETNHPMQLSASWKSAWIWSHLPLSPAYKYQRPELPILGNSRPFGGPISHDKLSSKIIQWIFQLTHGASRTFCLIGMRFAAFPRSSPVAPLSWPPPPRDKTKYESVRLKKLPAFYLWLESQTFSTHWFSQLLQKSSYTCSTPQSDIMCLAKKSYQNWSKDKGIRVPYWERRVT